ncbi:MAG: hypothetical protein E3J82_01260 [Candidatus Thorarchaeota archaeon]|nr:MAG: hypothetical protein E3J82_01260 [Candidatus Thorarchaeota archaeon]
MLAEKRRLGTMLGILVFSFTDLHQSSGGGHLGLSSNFYEDVVAVCDHPINSQMRSTADAYRHILNQQRNFSASAEGCQIPSHQ